MILKFITTLTGDDCVNAPARLHEAALRARNDGFDADAALLYALAEQAARGIAEDATDTADA